MDHDALAQEVAAIAAQAERLETPGPNGPCIWHRWGQGPALVLLHGGWGSWTHWYRSIPLLAPHFTLLAADTPGFGDSAAPPKPTSPDDIADILVAGLDEVRIRPLRGSGPAVDGVFTGLRPGRDGGHVGAGDRNHLERRRLGRGLAHHLGLDRGTARQAAGRNEQNGCEGNHEAM